MITYLKSQEKLSERKGMIDQQAQKIWGKMIINFVKYNIEAI